MFRPSFPRFHLIMLALYLDNFSTMATPDQASLWSVYRSFTVYQVGLGSIGTTSSDRQSRKIDVQHERTPIAELDTPPPPTSIVFPTPKIQKSLPHSLKRPRR